MTNAQVLMAKVFTRITFLHSIKFGPVWNSLRKSTIQPSLLSQFQKMSSSPTSSLPLPQEKEDDNLKLDNLTNTCTTSPTSINGSTSIISQQTLPKTTEAIIKMEKVICNAAEGEAEIKPKRVRLRKMILLLSYSGQGYLGMQKNPGTKTIEDDLLQALFKANYIQEEWLNKPQIISFQRAARTDKSVSAARQIVSLKLPDNFEISNANEHLPPQIRVMGFKRVTQNFDAKGNCDARTYSYMLPTFAFVPIEEKTTENYRITPDVLEKVRETLKIYIGTKNYHNFTSKIRPKDPSANRFIMSFTCSDPFVQDGLEFVVLRVKGQSFMLHQIRKMIGLVLALLRGFAGKDTIEKVWGQERIDIPRAPGLGLMLEQVHYERYDRRFGMDGIHEKLTWEKLDDKIEAFCKTYIYPNITKTENEEKSMLNWLSTLPFHTYDVRVVHLHEEPTGDYSKIGKAFFAVSNKTALEEDCEDGAEDQESSEGNAKRVKLS